LTKVNTVYNNELRTLMNAQSIRDRTKAELRALILNTARSLFVHEGYESFSLRKVAQQVGYSPAAIYKHFSSKKDIFESLTEESFAALVQASAAITPAPGEDPVHVLKRGMHAYVAFGLANPDHYRFAFLLPAQKSATPAAPYRPRPAYSALRDRVQRCIDSERLRSGNLDLFAQSLWSAVHGVTSLLVQRPEFPWVDRDQLIARVIESAVQGLLAESTPPANGGRHGRSNLAPNIPRKPSRQRKAASL
jgi:AcrR family transcriptional regulator